MIYNGSKVYGKEQLRRLREDETFGVVLLDRVMCDDYLTTTFVTLPSILTM